MSKTIEEAAKSIAKDFIMENKSRINNDAPLTHECVQYAIERIFSMPLSERLTAEEKERVRANYADAKDIHSRCVGTMSKNHIADLLNEYNKGLNRGIMIVLKHLFGADFFKEGE